MIHSLSGCSFIQSTDVVVVVARARTGSICSTQSSSKYYIKRATECLAMQFYNGDVKMEPGAVVCRVSPSFIRFGTFQLPVSRGTDQHHLCETLVEYLQKHHFPDLVGKPDANLKMLETIVDSTAELVVKWQLIGFVHGV